MTSETLSHETAINKCGELAALVDQQIDGKTVHATAIDPLLFARECDPSTATMHSVSPHLAIVVQGQNKCC